MKVKIEFEVDNCTKCPFHEKHQVYTPDSFEHEVGIYCAITDDTHDSRERHTYDGEIQKRLVTSDNWHPEEDAETPGWCPFLLKQYRELILEMHQSSCWEQAAKIYTGVGHPSESINFYRGVDYINNLITEGSLFLGGLAESKIESLLYGEWHHSVERDVYLMTIVAMLHNLTISMEVRADAKIAKKESELAKEDKDIIADAILNWTDGPAFIKKFNEEKTRLKAEGRKPALDTGTAIKVSLYLADALVIARKPSPSSRGPSGSLSKEYKTAERASQMLSSVTNTEFKLVFNPEIASHARYGKNFKNAAELHYTTDGDFDPSVFKS